MIHIIRAEERHFTDFDWLKTYWLFSFFVYLTGGELTVDGAQLYTKDQARIDAEAPLTLTAYKDTRFVLIDVPSCRGWGYDQATLRGAQG